MMWIKENIMLILCLAGVVWLSGCLVKECEHNAELKSEVEAVNNFLDIEKQESIKRDSLHAQEVKSMKQNIISEQSARILLQKEFERFKSVQSQVRAEMTSRIDTMYIPYEKLDTVIVDNYKNCIPKDTVKKYFIQIPRKSKFEDKWMKLYTTTDTGLMIDSMRLINKFDITIGYKKPDKPFKFLRRKKPVVELTNYNPYTSVNHINNIVVKNDKNQIKTIAVSGIIGFITGFVSRHFIK